MLLSTDTFGAARVPAAHRGAMPGQGGCEHGGGRGWGAACVGGIDQSREWGFS